jgi:heparan-alpha-glucosaminide N-acetyltransferase
MFFLYLGETIDYQIKRVRNHVLMALKNKSESFPKSGSPAASFDRIQSIDIIRAITMVLMIFVNDFWSLKDIPAWLGHVERGVDGIGLSDVIFPAFLFIVGLSLPYAVENRRKKGDSDWQLVKHVLSRTLALLVMGLFLVNGESINAEATGIKRWIWNPLSCLCFILIWNVYSKNINKTLVLILRAAGILTLLIMAYLYRGGEEGLSRFEPHWWGILGLIGWAYLASALITVFSRNNFYGLLAGWLFFCVLSVASKAGYVPAFLSFIPDAIRGGTLTGLTMGGVLAAFIFRYYVGRNDSQKLTLIFLVWSVVLIGLSVATRPYWGLAKLGATPAWLFLCSAFTLLAFLLIYWIADVSKKSAWFNFIKPAGTDTLLCYLVPTFMYMMFRLIGLKFPEVLITGSAGLLKSFCFALLCVLATRGLNRIGVKLKI